MENISILNIKKGIPHNELSTLNKIADVFHKNGYECYLIGGSVRDLIMGQECSDYDFATNALPEVVMKLFRRTVPTGIKHGTVTVLTGETAVEITTYRSDGRYIDGRRPQSVSFSSSLKQDVLRRDFTINGLAYDLANDEIIDYVNGIEDIRNKIIRTIGEPASRFSEDGLRTYRACRFASKLGFKIEENTFKAISETLNTAAKVSPERIRDELKKILETEKPSVGFELLRKSGLLKQVMPELDRCYGIMQNKFHIYDVYYHSLYSCDAAPADRPLIRLSALLHDIGKAPTRRMGENGDYTFYNHEVTGAKITRAIMKRLKFSNEEIGKVNNLVINHMFHYTEEWTDGAVRRFMRKVGVENLDDIFMLRLADRKGNGSRNGLPEPIKRLKKRINKIIEEENAISLRDLDINGNLIMERYGLKPGPIIGKILNELLEIILDNPEMNEREELCFLADRIVKRIESER